MPAKIRLARHGRRKNPFYHIVVADARAPRDGKFIQKLGVYNPMTKPATIDLDRNAAFDWIMKGAQPTDTVRAILKFKGVFYKKHLQRGVSKGSMSQEEADTKYQAWIDEKEAKVAKRREVEQALIIERRKAISEGTPKVRVVAATEALVEFASTVVEDAPASEVVAETPAAEETVAEEVAAETPAAEETVAEAEVEAPAKEEAVVKEEGSVKEEAPVAAKEEAPAEATAETPEKESSEEE